MKTNFDGDELVISLEKSERDWLRKLRNITKELGRYHPLATAASEALTKIMPLVNEDGVFAAAKEVESGDTNVVPGTNAGDAAATSTATTAKGGGR